jgi:hypothetical protein
MRFVDQESAGPQLRRTQPLGAELDHRLRGLREASDAAAVARALRERPSERGRWTGWSRLFRVLWPRTARPPA